MADEEVTFTEAGKVATGFSFPYVAKYAASAGAITYSGAMELARGVNVTPSPTTSDENKFYANNQEAESAGGKFTGGTVKLTVDGLLTKAERFILGLPEADSDGWTAYGDDAKAPYVGIGYITRWMSGGVESWQPTIIVKAKFQQPEKSAATQEDAIDFQTQELTADMFRGDDAKHNWKYMGKDYATEAEALDALKKKLGVKA